MRNRAERRHQVIAHMMRRLKEDRNQHYDDLTCPCWTNPKAMARFKEQPKVTGRKCSCCSNPRLKRNGSQITIQEMKANDNTKDSLLICDAA